MGWIISFAFLVLLIAGTVWLMDIASAKIRERIVLPLLAIQQYALQKIERQSKHTPVYEKMVERSLYGNINASRNSA